MSFNKKGIESPGTELMDLINSSPPILLANHTILLATSPNPILLLVHLSIFSLQEYVYVSGKIQILSNIIQVEIN